MFTIVLTRGHEQLNSRRLKQESIELFRGGSAVVSSLAGAFGSGLQETRLTALIGYLIALAPDVFCRRFGFKGTPLRVHIERPESSGRSDVIVETSLGIGVIEAKIDGRDPSTQAFGYGGKWIVLLTDFIPPLKNQRAGVRYFAWSDFANLLSTLAKYRVQEIAFVSRDLIRYLKDHGMLAREQEHFREIYARELNTEATLLLFLKCHIYGCKADNSESRRAARYFSPYICQGAAAACPGVGEGLSYVARINSSFVAESFDDFLEGVRCDGAGGTFIKRHRLILNTVKSWKWEQRRLHFFLLGPPRLVFHPPLHKNILQKTSGNLSTRSWSFDQLFELRDTIPGRRPK